MSNTSDAVFEIMQVGDCAVIAGSEDAVIERLEVVRNNTGLWPNRKGFQFRVTPSLTGPEQVVRRVR